MRLGRKAEVQVQVWSWLLCVCWEVPLECLLFLGGVDACIAVLRVSPSRVVNFSLRLCTVSSLGSLSLVPMVLRVLRPCGPEVQREIGWAVHLLGGLKREGGGGGRCRLFLLVTVAIARLALVPEPRAHRFVKGSALIQHCFLVRWNYVFGKSSQVGRSLWFRRFLI